MLTALIVNTFLVAVAVLIHYEMLRLLSIVMPKMTVRHHYRILFAFFVAILGHIIEVWLFAIGFYLMISAGTFGSIEGHFTHTLLDCGYFSFTNYTSLGYGDIIPLGHLRYLAGVEALTGLLMITWTASFMFIEMEKFWDKE